VEERLAAKGVSVGGTMAPITLLLLIYAAALAISALLSGLLWAKYRTPINRNLFLVWGFSLLSLVVQGAPTSSPFLMTLTYCSVFPVSLALATLLASVVGIEAVRRPYLMILVVAVALSSLAAALGLPFWMVSLPAAIAMSTPPIDVAIRSLRHRFGKMTTSAKAAAVTCVIYGLHNLDYPFLRDKPELNLLGFSLAFLVVFALSITVPAAVLERVAGERAAIEQVAQMRSRFFANITHELRTPLTTILAPLEGLLAEDFGSLTSTQRAYLESNQRSAIRLLRLINDLLDLAKMEEGFLRLRVAKTDLRTLLEEVVNFTRPLAVRKNLTVDLVLRNQPENLHADAEKMERVLVNLISNALKFTAVGGVTITLDCKDGGVEISVTDTGIGIAAEALPRIFERFNQADQSVTRRFGGTGIGLAYAKEIVELHGGKVTVESTPGKGSRFLVSLREGADSVPQAVRDRRFAATSRGQVEGRRLEDQEPKEWVQKLKQQSEYRLSAIEDVTDGRAVSGGGPPGQTARILVVEDNLEILDFVSLHLRHRYTVLAAENGRMGLELARRENPDLIVTDFMMPELDGLSMVQELRADRQFNETSIIMLTAKNHLEDRLAGREAGVDVYLAKPFSPRELDLAIRQLLEKRGKHVSSLMRAHAQGLEVVSGGLAHEIHNPLNFIKGAQMMIVESVAKLREQVAGAALTDPVRIAAIDKLKLRIEKLSRSAAEGVSRIEGVVDLMRRYAREGYPKEISNLPFDQTIKEVARLVAPPIDIECTLKLELTTGKREIRCIPEEFNQVIRGLVQNALEAATRQAVIWVKTRVEGQNLLLEVTDNGPGIAADALTKIFSPFFTTKAGTGRGIGLAIAQLVVSRSGGTIEVNSVPAVETTFRVRMPMVRSEAVPLLLTSERGSSELSARP
jgi:signal transduction histidine kinase